MATSTASAAQLIDAREAARIALDWVARLYDDQEEPLSDLGLEEISRSEDAWTVTVGFSRRWSRDVTDIAAYSGASPFYPRHTRERDYKKVRIDAHSGEVLGMEIRVF